MTSRSRRTFLGTLTSAMAAASAAGCLRQPDEDMSSYVQEQPGARPGRGRDYATSTLLDGMATGVLARCVDGRPIKIEGHPEHPASLGGTGSIEQASILDLYDPERLRKGTHTWDDLLRRVGELRKKTNTRRIAFVLEPHSSPWRAHWIDRVRAVWPSVDVVTHAPLHDQGMREATTALFGQPLSTRYRFDRADVVLSLGHDFMASGPGWLRYAREAAERRRDPDAMSRLYVAETTLTVTGTYADHRIARPPTQLLAAARATLQDVQHARPGALAWTRDLLAHRGRCLVTAPWHASAALHEVALALNAALGNLGRTIELIPPVTTAVEPDGLERLADAEVVVVVGGDPVRTAAGAPLAKWIEAAPWSVYTGLYENETSRACDWVLPAAHPFESWGLARAFDGTLSTLQPLIRPLYDGRSPDELLAAFAARVSSLGADDLRSFWQSSLPFDDVIARGFAPDSQFDPVDVTPVTKQERAPELPVAPPSTPRTLELDIQPDPILHDGRFAHNAWLRELPHPTTGLSWESAAHVGPRTAQQLGLSTGDVIAARSMSGESVRVPVLVLTEHAEGALTLDVGFGVHRLGAAAASPFAPGSQTVHVDRTGHTVTLTRTQPVDRVSLPDDARVPERTVPAHEGEGPQWAMVIDLNVCTGCSACVTACQAENNIPSVGAAEVQNGRLMHWIRMERYESPDGGPHALELQPVACQHCENAPCEYVCPVNATVHSDDGLNEMVYNRCVGTRFCSSNCPYKARRFNWFDYRPEADSPLTLAMNPQVTVRDRGVMEKCTYCVQRLRTTDASDVVTACQQACPTRAITFGSQSDPASAVSRALASPRTYSLLDHLGTSPRTRYQRRTHNCNESEGPHE